MKFIKRYKISLVLAAAVITISGCQKFLEEKDPSNLTPDNFYTIPEHAEAAIAAAYSNTRFLGGGAGIFANNFQMLEAVSGTAKQETGQNAELNNLTGLSYNSDNLFVRNWWNGLYGVIAQANLVLSRVPGINPMDEAQKKRVLAEARFLRAWAYFYAVRLWGDIPLITEPVNATSPELYPTRISREIVYDTIVNDLVMAEASGLSWTDQTGRASMGAVKSLLAKVYLTMAGQPLNKGTAYYQLAANKAKEVIDSDNFSLFMDYGDLHNVATENRGELIFQIQYLNTVSSSPFQGVLLPNFKEVSAYGTEIGSTVPTSQFYASYEPGDLRAVDRKGFFYTRYYDGGSGTLKDLSAPYIFKHFDSVAHGSAGRPGTANSSLNYTLIRYAEVLLIYAEAQNEVGAAPSVDAYNALKEIRDRAQLLTPLMGTYTQQTFREAVWRERWHELAYEGITWFDMVRLMKVYDEGTNSFDDFVGHVFPDNGAVLKDIHVLFPLPIAEMRNNPNLTPQNNGYQ